MAVLIWIPLLLPVALAGLSFVLRRRWWTLWLPVLASGVLLGAGVVLVVFVGSHEPLTTAGGLLRVDSLSAWMLTVVGVVAGVSLWGGMPKRSHENPRIGSFATLLCLFLAAMTLAVFADNVGLMWVAIELTTITTAFLVASRGDRDSLEAAWKYVVLGAVGVAIAFLGIGLLSAAGHAGGESTLSWVALLGNAPNLDPSLARAAGALAVLGFATKAGLAPMHSWLPDAHSQAPAPVSGLMSGVLLSVAFYVILRIQAITDAAIGPDLMRQLLLTAGLLSLAVTAGLVTTQRDFKRLLAYSSIEHMGLLAIGAAAGGPVAIAAVLLHMLAHGLVKSSMFVIAGRILSYTGSHRVADVRNLLRHRPDLGSPFLLGAAALLCFPPFATFFTEVAIIVSGFQRGLVWQMLLACALLLAVFAGLGRHVLAMTLGTDPDPSPAQTTTRASVPSQVPVWLALAATALVGFYPPLSAVLQHAVAALGGAR